MKLRLTEFWCLSGYIGIQAVHIIGSCDEKYVKSFARIWNVVINTKQYRECMSFFIMLLFIYTVFPRSTFGNVNLSKVMNATYDIMTAMALHIIVSLCTWRWRSDRMRELTAFISSLHIDIFRHVGIIHEVDRSNLLHYSNYFLRLSSCSLHQ